MLPRHIIAKNEFLNISIMGYYNRDYIGYGKPGNPDFLNVLKNTFDKESMVNLLAARDQVVEILKRDLPYVITEKNMRDCLVICVPRAKAHDSYSSEQLMFIEAVSMAAKFLENVNDGTNCIYRIKNTKTTHLRYASGIPNDGDDPYPGITKDTCFIDTTRIKGRKIILVDDIYTKTVNIDEDCIQALFDNGAAKVVFYSIAYTRSKE